MASIVPMVERSSSTQQLPSPTQSHSPTVCLTAKLVLLCRLQGDRQQHTCDGQERDQAAALATSPGPAHVPLHVHRAWPDQAAQQNAVLTPPQVSACICGRDLDSHCYVTAKFGMGSVALVQTGHRG